MAFLFCAGSHVVAYSEDTIERVAEAAKRDSRIMFIFTKYIPSIRISMALGLRTGIHTVGNYCDFVQCNENELKSLLKSSFSPEYRTVDETMIKDFMELAFTVNKRLEREQFQKFN